MILCVHLKIKGTKGKTQLTLASYWAHLGTMYSCRDRYTYMYLAPTAPFDLPSSPPNTELRTDDRQIRSKYVRVPAAAVWLCWSAHATLLHPVPFRSDQPPTRAPVVTLCFVCLGWASLVLVFLLRRLQTPSQAPSCSRPSCVRMRI